MEHNNEIFLRTIQDNCAYKQYVSSSFQELKKWKSLQFRKGQHWYQYDKWCFPNAGVIREWEAVDNNWIPKATDFECTESLKFNIVFDIEKCIIPENYLLQDVRLSPEGDYLVLVLSSSYGTDLVGIKKYTMEEIFEIRDISLESSFYLGKYGVIFSRHDSDFRPNKLFYRDLESNKEELLFEESEQSFRIKIMYGDENSCFIKCSDLYKGKIFLYISQKSRLEKYSFSNDICILPRDIILLNWKGDKFFLTLTSNSEGRDIITIKNLLSSETKIIAVPYVERSRRVYWIYGQILLDCSTESSSLFYILDFLKAREGEVEFEKISFEKKTIFYENSYSNDLLLFLENSTFHDKVFSYGIASKCLREEIELSNIADSEKYHTKVIFANTNDNSVQIPITLFWKKEDNTMLPRKSKCILNVYGAYGKNENTKLDSTMLSIINAGFTYAIVHVRGGGYFGGSWYREGKGLKKWNSITDFIDSVDYLINSNIVDEQKLGLVASSAGGVIAGAVLNERNNLLKSILLFSPFINPYDSLQNTADPLSKTEVFEWGDINSQNIRDYIRSYSPMQNVEKATGSNTILMSVLGEKDPYINNNEVLKWSEKLNGIGVKSLVLLNRDAGHGGFTISDDDLMVDTLSYFLKVVGEEL